MIILYVHPVHTSSEVRMLPPTEPILDTPTRTLDAWMVVEVPFDDRSCLGRSTWWVGVWRDVAAK